MARLAPLAEAGALTVYAWALLPNHVHLLVRTEYLYQGSAIYGEYDPTWTTPLARSAHGPGIDQPLLRTTPLGTQAFHPDGLGSIIGLTDATGTLTAWTQYDPWGNVLASSGTLPQYGYTGREPDGTGLVYYRARYYDPTLGRFTQRDPVGLQGGINPYAYVGGNPVNRIDPEGLTSEPADINSLTRATSYTPGASSPVEGTLVAGLDLRGIVDANQGVRGELKSLIPDFLLPCMTPLIDFLFPIKSEALAGQFTDNILWVVSGFGVVGPTSLKPALRQLYEAEVRSLEEVGLNMRAAGGALEDTARMLHQMRRDLGETFKDLTPTERLKEITERNIKIYGDPLGPSIDWLRQRGRSWLDIINGAARPGGRDLGF